MSEILSQPPWMFILFDIAKNDTQVLGLIQCDVTPENRDVWEMMIMKHEIYETKKRHSVQCSSARGPCETVRLSGASKLKWLPYRFKRHADGLTYSPMRSLAVAMQNASGTG